MTKPTDSSTQSVTRSIKSIPIDRKRVKADGEFFGRAFNHLLPVEEGGHIVYSIKNKDFTLDYRFDKKKSEKLKEALKLNAVDGHNFSLGRRAARLWYSMVFLAAEQGQGRGNRGSFSINDIVKLWDCKRSGRLYADIQQTFLSLATFNPHYSNNQVGANRVEWGHSFFNTWCIGGEGDTAVFNFELNQAALGITHEWLNNGLSYDSLRGGYTSIKLKDLKQTQPDSKYANFLERVRLLKPGRPCTLKFITILTDWIKVREDFLRKRSACHSLVYSYLEKAQKEGEIKNFKTYLPGLTQWREEWKVEITK